jgi:hypothetical protein
MTFDDARRTALIGLGSLALGASALAAGSAPATAAGGSPRQAPAIWPI